MEAILTREVVSDKAVCRIIGILVFVILTSLGAFVRIPLPFTPVPVTLQTFFVLLGAAFLGGSLGVSVQLGYIFLGAIGLPIFTGGASGFFYLLGPTGGYLFGFILAALFIGRFIKYAKDNLFSIFILFCLGDLFILGCGTIWLKAILGLSLKNALLMGFLPFIAGDLFKASIACIIYLKLKARLKEIF